MERNCLWLFIVPCSVAPTRGERLEKDESRGYGSAVLFPTGFLTFEI